MPSLPPPPSVVRRPLHISAAALVGLVTAMALTACGGAKPVPSGSPGGSSGGSSGPSSQPASPSPSSAVGAIDHKTGATDIVLRIDQGGGFVPLDFLASQAPTFTLYGNGVIVFQSRLATPPQPDASGITHNAPWRTAKMDEGQIQELLGFAITQGGLGTARELYMGHIADAPSTIFTIRAGGLDKTVTINALSEDNSQGPDALARAAFFKLAERLRDFDRGGSIGSDVYEPTAFRAVLSERDAGGVQPVAWPWPALKRSDFKEGPNDGSGGILLPHRTMTPDEIAALGVKDVTGGLQGVVLKGPDGKIYGLTTRPLLAEEKE